MVAQLVPQPHPILAAVTTGREALTAVRDAQPVYMSPAEKKTAITEIARLEAMTAELKLRIVATADDAANLSAGARDTGAWLASVTRADFGAGRAEARLAEALDRRWDPGRGGDGRRTRVGGPGHGWWSRRSTPSRRTSDPALVERAEAEMVDLCARVPAQRAAPPRPAPPRRHRTGDRRGRGSQTTRGRGTARAGEDQPALRRHRRRHGADHDRAPRLDRDRLLTYLESFTSHPASSRTRCSGEEDRIPHHRRLGQAFGALLEHLDPDQASRTTAGTQPRCWSPSDWNPCAGRARHRDHRRRRGRCRLPRSVGSPARPTSSPSSSAGRPTSTTAYSSAPSPPPRPRPDVRIRQAHERRHSLPPPHVGGRVRTRTAGRSDRRALAARRSRRARR